jgi:hypothetical protein
MLPSRPVDDLEQWYQAAMLPEVPSDPRVELRRARPEEAERIWDLVDVAFGVTRPRAMYEWLYQRNPSGMARSFVGVERSSGRFVLAVNEIPWPAARGEQALRAVVGIDRVVAPDWRRQRTALSVKTFRQAHPWYRDTVRIAWPNQMMRHSMERDGRLDELAGVLETAVLPINPAKWLAERGMPRGVAAAAGRTWDRVLRARQHRWTRGDATLRELQRFEAVFDALTARVSAWPLFWCPHSAEFLNWRYCAHPVHSYVAHALSFGDEPAGYSVVRIDGDTAVLMELVSAPGRSAVTRRLLAAASRTARDGGCTAIAVHAAPGWSHWPTIRQAGFWRRTPRVMLKIEAPSAPDAYRVERWQLSGGDVDAL